MKEYENSDHYISSQEPQIEDYKREDYYENYQPIFNLEKKNNRKLNKKKLHWRNTAYLSQFMNRFSHIKPRRLTNLAP